MKKNLAAAGGCIEERIQSRLFWARGSVIRLDCLPFDHPGVYGGRCLAGDAPLFAAPGLR